MMAVQGDGKFGPEADHKIPPNKQKSLPDAGSFPREYHLFIYPIVSKNGSILSDFRIIRLL